MLLTCFWSTPARVTTVWLLDCTPEPVANAPTWLTWVMPVLKALLLAMTRTSSSAPVPRTVGSLSTKGASARLFVAALQEPSRTSSW